MNIQTSFSVTKFVMCEDVQFSSLFWGNTTKFNKQFLWHSSRVEFFSPFLSHLQLLPAAFDILKVLEVTFNRGHLLQLPWLWYPCFVKNRRSYVPVAPTELSIKWIVEKYDFPLDMLPACSKSLSRILRKSTVFFHVGIIGDLKLVEKWVASAVSQSHFCLVPRNLSLFPNLLNPKSTPNLCQPMYKMDLST